MSNNKKAPVSPNVRTASASAPSAVPVSKPLIPQQPASSSASPFFRKENFVLMLTGIALVVIGFLLMIGGRSEDPNEFHADEIYSARRIVLAPILVLLGFAVEVFAILWKPKN